MFILCKINNNISQTSENIQQNTIQNNIQKTNQNTIQNTIQNSDQKINHLINIINAKDDQIQQLSHRLIENNLPFVSKIRSLKNSKKLILITLIFILLQSNWLSQFFEKYINISGKKIIIYILIIILFILFTHIILSLKN